MNFYFNECFLTDEFDHLLSVITGFKFKGNGPWNCGQCKNMNRGCVRQAGMENPV